MISYGNFFNTDSSKPKLILLVYKATLTKDVSFFGMDPYYIAILGKHKKYSSSVRTTEGKYPMFNETCEFTYEDESTLQINFYHSSKLVRKAFKD
jgi:hypothetical protein